MSNAPWGLRILTRLVVGVFFLLLSSTSAKLANITVSVEVQSGSSPICWVIQQWDDTQDWYNAWEYYTYYGGYQSWSSATYYSENTIWDDVKEDFFGDACTYDSDPSTGVSYECFGSTSASEAQEKHFCRLAQGDYVIVAASASSDLGTYEVTVGGAELVGDLSTEDAEYPYTITSFTVDSLWTDACSGDQTFQYAMDYNSTTGRAESTYLSPNLAAGAGSSVACGWVLTPNASSSGGAKFDSVWVTPDDGALGAGDTLKVYDGRSASATCLYASDGSCGSAAATTYKSSARGGPLYVAYSYAGGGYQSVGFEVAAASCVGGPSCGGHGSCEEGQCACDAGWGNADCSVPTAWACADGRYNASDGVCDCNCGAYDPNCPAVTDLVAGCNETKVYAPSEMWEYGAIDDGAGGFCTFCTLPESMPTTATYPADGATVCADGGCTGDDEVCDAQTGLCITPEDTYEALGRTQLLMACAADADCAGDLGCSSEGHCAEGAAAAAAVSIAAVASAGFRLTTEAEACAAAFNYSGKAVEEGSCAAACAAGAYGIDYDAFVAQAQAGVESALPDVDLAFLEDECQYASSSAATVNVLAQASADCAVVSLAWDASGDLANPSFNGSFALRRRADGALAADALTGALATSNSSAAAAGAAYCLAAGKYELEVQAYGYSECFSPIYMWDTYGDGWGDWVLSLYEQDDLTTSIQDLAVSAINSSVCLDVKPDTCYVLTNSSDGSWKSEIGFDFCGNNISYTAQDAAAGGLSFCTDTVGSCLPDDVAVLPLSVSARGVDLLDYSNATAWAGGNSGVPGVAFAAPVDVCTGAWVAAEFKFENYFWRTTVNMTGANLAAATGDPEFVLRSESQRGTDLIGNALTAALPKNTTAEAHRFCMPAGEALSLNLTGAAQGQAWYFTLTQEDLGGEALVLRGLLGKNKTAGAGASRRLFDQWEGDFLDARRGGGARAALPAGAVGVPRRRRLGGSGCGGAKHQVTLHLNDSYGDGWGGEAQWAVYSESGTVGSGELAEGYHAAVDLCLAGEACYVVDVEHLGSTFYAEERWSVCGSFYYYADVSVTIYVDADGGCAVRNDIECDVSAQTDQEQYADIYDSEALDFAVEADQWETGYATPGPPKGCDDTAYAALYISLDWVTFEYEDPDWEVYKEASFSLKNLGTQSAYDAQLAEMSGAAAEPGAAFSFCLAPGRYELTLEDSYGDGWNGGYLYAYLRSAAYFGPAGLGKYTFLDGEAYAVAFEVAEVRHEVEVELAWSACAAALLRVDLDFTGVAWPSEASFAVYHAGTGSIYDTQDVAMKGAIYSSEAEMESYYFCVDPGNYTIWAYDSYGDGWYQADDDLSGKLTLSFVYAGTARTVKVLDWDYPDLDFYWNQNVTFAVEWPGEDPGYDRYPDEAYFYMEDLEGGNADLAGVTMAGAAGHGGAAFAFEVPVAPLRLRLYDTYGDGWGSGTYAVRYSLGGARHLLAAGTLADGAEGHAVVFFSGADALVSRDAAFARNATGHWGLRATRADREQHGCGCEECNAHGFNLTVAEPLAMAELGVTDSTLEAPYATCNLLEPGRARASFHFSAYGQPAVVDFRRAAGGGWEAHNHTDGRHLGAWCYDEGSYEGECAYAGREYVCPLEGEEAEEGTCAMYSAAPCAATPDYPYALLGGNVSFVGALLADDLACAVEFAPDIPAAARPFAEVAVELALPSYFQDEDHGFLDVRVVGSPEGELAAATESSAPGDGALGRFRSAGRLAVNVVQRDYALAGYRGRPAAGAGTAAVAFNATEADMTPGAGCAAGAADRCLGGAEGLVVVNRSALANGSSALAFQIVTPAADAVHLRLLRNGLAWGERLRLEDSDGAPLAEVDAAGFAAGANGALRFDAAQEDAAYGEFAAYPESVLAWARADALGGGGDLALLSDGNVTWGLTAGGVPFLDWNGQARYADAAVAEGEWHHLAYSLLGDAGMVQFLVDGAFVATCGDIYDDSSSSSSSSSEYAGCPVPDAIDFGSGLTPQDGVLYVGQNPRAAASDFSLTLDALALHGRRVYPAEVANLLANGSRACSTADADLLGCYHFEEEFGGYAGEVAADGGPAGRDLTVNGASSAAGPTVDRSLGLVFASAGGNLTVRFESDHPDWYPSGVAALLAYEGVSCDCGAHGRCGRGVCVCDPGWAGEACDEWLVSDACSSDTLGVASISESTEVEILAAAYRSDAAHLYPAVQALTAGLPAGLNCTWAVSRDKAQAYVDLSDLASCAGAGLSLVAYEGLLRAGDAAPAKVAAWLSAFEGDEVVAAGGELTVNLALTADASCDAALAGKALTVGLHAPRTFFVAPGSGFASNASAPSGDSQNPYTDLAETIAAAASGDTLVLYPGRYDGALDLFVAQPLTLKSMAGSAATVIDGGDGADRFLTVQAVGEVKVEGFTFTRGGAGEGSILYADSGAVVMDDCVFKNNGDADGSATGALHVVSPASLELSNSEFEGNAAEKGAAIYLDGAQAALANITFSGNEADEGGAVYLGSSSKVLSQGAFTDCTIIGNSAETGGAIFSDRGAAVLKNTVISGNSATGKGGAISATESSIIKVTGGALKDNDGSRGTAVYLTGNSTLTLTSTSVSNHPGSAIYASGGSTVTLSNTAVFENEASRRRRLATWRQLDVADYAPALHAVDSRVYILGSEISSHDADLSPVVLEGCGGRIADTTFHSNKAQSGGGALSLLECANSTYGGVTVQGSTFANNSAEDYGGGAIYASASALTVHDSVFEFNSASENGGSLALEGCEDEGEHAVALAGSAFRGNAAGGFGGALYADGAANVAVAGSVFSGNRAGEDGGSVHLTDSRLVMEQTTVAGSQSSGDFGGGVSIDGTEAILLDVVIEDCKGSFGGGFAAYGESSYNWTSGVLRRNQGVQGGGMTVESLSAPTIKNVDFLENTATEDGGGIFVARARPEPGIPMLEGCEFENNTAAGIGGDIYLALTDGVIIRDVVGRSASAVAGAAVASLASELTLDAVEFEGLSGQQGAALYLVHSMVAIADSTLSGHSALESGGALYTFQTSLNISGSVFSGNSARRGGAIFLFDSAAALEDTAFVGNEATEQGGAVALLENDALTFQGCSFWGNTAGEEGGAVLLDRSGGSFSNSYFADNRVGLEGGAIFVEDGHAVAIHNCTLVNNGPWVKDAGAGCGGAVRVYDTASLSVNHSAFVGNGWVGVDRLGVENGTVGTNDGGALCLECTPTTVTFSTFVSNWGYMGGAIYSGVEECSTTAGSENAARRLDTGHTSHSSSYDSDHDDEDENLLDLHRGRGMPWYHRDRNASAAVALTNCTFGNNTATGGGGGVYWLVLPPEGLTLNAFRTNRALYGPVVAGPPAFITPHHNGLQEKSGYSFRTPVQVHVKDVYNQTVRTENSHFAFAQLNSGELTWEEDNPLLPTPSLHGQTLEQFVEGVAYFDEIVVSKYPDTHVNLTFVAPDIVSNEASIPLYLRACIRGEILPEGGGVCIRCDPGTFSWNTSDTMCHACPVGAVCYGGDHIKSLQDYWHFLDSPGNFLNGLYYLHKCNTVGACIGDVVLADGAAEVGGYYIKSDGEGTDFFSSGAYGANYWTTCQDADTGSYGDCYVNVNGESYRVHDSDDAVTSSSIRLERNVSEAAMGQTVYLQQEEACAANYAGNLCNNCDTGAGKSGGVRCASCVGGRAFSITAMILAMVAIVCASIVVIRSQLNTDEVEENDKLSIQFKILASYMQLVSLFRAMKLSWPAYVMALFKAQSAISSAGDALLSIDCVLNYAPEVSVSLFYQKLTFYMLLPVVIVLGCAVFWAVDYKILLGKTQKKPLDVGSEAVRAACPNGLVTRQNVEKILRAAGHHASPMKVDEIARSLNVDSQPAELSGFQAAYEGMLLSLTKKNATLSIIVLLFIVHPNVSQYALEVFACSKFENGTYGNPDKWYLLPDHDVECYTADYWAWAMMVGLPGILAYAVGIPIAAGYALHTIRHELDTLSAQLQYGFLFTGFKREYYFWEIWITIRKIVIVFVTVFVHQIGPLTEITSAIMVICFSIALQLQTNPYEEQDVNTMEANSLYVSLLTLLFGLYFYADEADDGSSIFFIVAIMLFNLGFVCYFIKNVWRAYLESLLERARGIPILKKYVPAPREKDEDDRALLNSEDASETHSAHAHQIIAPRDHTNNARSSAAGLQLFTPQEGTPRSGRGTPKIVPV